MIYISQGSVSTQLRCGGILSNHSIYGNTDCAGKKIGNRSTKATISTNLLFWGHPVYATSL